MTSGITPELLAALTQPWAELSLSQKKEIARLETDLDLNQRQIRAALEILDEAVVQPERLAVKLIEIAEQFKALQAVAATQSGDAPQIAALKLEAKKAIDAGDLAKADALLAEVEAEQRRALDRFAFNAAETSAQRGDIALARLRYAETAQHFAEAARTLPVGHDQERWNYLGRQAFALYRQGDEFGDNPALAEAINVLRRCLALSPRSERPLDWAMTQNNLGNTLAQLGERAGEAARLEEAVTSYREALQENTRARAPFDWAMTQMNLGNTLAQLGERAGEAARLEQAVTAYREVLQERTRARAVRLGYHPDESRQCA